MSALAISPIETAQFIPTPELFASGTSVPNTAQVKDASNIVSKTVFIKVRFGTLGNARKVAGTDVLETDADTSLLKVSKQLLTSDELEAIRKADGKMRTWLYNTCLPFDMGVMLLPIGLIEAAEEKMAEYKTERAVLVDAFVAAYPKLCEEAAQHLGSLYNSLDYPGVEEVRSKFFFEWQYVSFGVPGQLKGISSAMFKKEQEKAEKQMQAATEEITALMRQTLLELVTNLQDRLTPTDDGKNKILRESTVTKLTEFLNTFNLKNVTDDTELAAQVQKIKELMNGASATTIRDSDLWREKIRSGMDSISGTLSTMVEVKPIRKFKDE